MYGEPAERVVYQSTPIENIFTTPVQTPFYQFDYMDINRPLTEWEQKLQSMMYNNDMKQGVYIMNDEGMVIHNGVIPLVS
jgi:hypothetical protein